MATPYIRVWDSFMARLADPELARLSVDDLRYDCMSWMNEALTYLKMKNLSLDSDLSLRDDEALEFEDDLTLEEIEILAVAMVGSYYSRKVNSVALTEMFIGTSGEKFDSQTKFKAAMIDARDYWFEECKRLHRDRNALTNSYLEDIL